MEALVSEISIDKQSLSKQIYDHLKTQIIENIRKPGDKLSIASIAEELGISRSPVVMAMAALEHEGFIVIIPQRGTFVRSLTYEELDVVYRTRAAFERMIAENSIGLADRNGLLQYREKFFAFLKESTFDTDKLRELFYLEVDFHTFLYSYFPEIARREFNTITELTKRSRFLNLENEATKKQPQKIKEKDVGIHIRLIDAMLTEDVSLAMDIAEQDVMLTRKNVLDFLYPYYYPLHYENNRKEQNSLKKPEPDTFQRLNHDFIP